MKELAWSETASWVGQLEWPQEVGTLLEVGTNGEYLLLLVHTRRSLILVRTYLVNQVLDADNAIFAKVLLNDAVVGKGNALLVAVMY